MEFAATLAVLNAVLTLPFLFFSKWQFLEPLPLLILVANSCAAAIAFFLVMHAVRHMEVSTASPFFLFEPALIVILAFLFLNEGLTRGQVGGIGLLLFGTYVLETHKFRNALEPLRELMRSRYIHFILLAMFIYSLTAIGDRFVLSRYNIEPWTYLALAQILVALAYMAMLSIFHDGVKGITNGFKVSGGWIFLIALFTIGYRLADVFAVKISYVGLVQAVKKLSVFFSVLIGGELFHEHNLGRKVLASAIMLAGAILIVI